MRRTKKECEKTGVDKLERYKITNKQWCKRGGGEDNGKSRWGEETNMQWGEWANWWRMFGCWEDGWERTKRAKEVERIYDEKRRTKLCFTPTAQRAELSSECVCIKEEKKKACFM